MKKVVFLLFLISILGCGSTRRGSTNVDENRPDGLQASVSNKSTVEASDPGSPFMFADSLRMKELLSYLASDELKGRDTGSEGIELAARRLEKDFEAFGIKPYFEDYRDQIADFDTNAFNLVGYAKGTDRNLRDQILIIGAHYDHIGLVPPTEKLDSIANGANDNASGTTVVMELARYFGQTRTNKRSIMFVLFSAEEKGLIGSKHLAKRLGEEDLDIYTMLNFEMVGVPLEEKEYHTYLTGYSRSNLAEVVNRYAGEQLTGFLPKAAEFGLFQRSDNFPFHQVFSVPSQTFCTFDFTNYGFYHKAGDEAYRMNYRHMAKLVDKFIPVVEGIANANLRELKYY